MMARDLKVVAVAGTCFPCMPHMPRAQRNSRELAGSVQTACNGGRYIYRRVVVLWRAVSVGIGWRWVGMGIVGYIIYAIHPIRAAQPAVTWLHTSRTGPDRPCHSRGFHRHRHVLSHVACRDRKPLGRRLARARGKLLYRTVRIIPRGRRAAKATCHRP
jgi:hypothetical protein